MRITDKEYEKAKRFLIDTAHQQILNNKKDELLYRLDLKKLDVAFLNVQKYNIDKGFSVGVLDVLEHVKDYEEKEYN